MQGKTEKEIGQELRYGLRYSQSERDVALYLVTLPRFDPSRISSVSLLVRAKDFCRIEQNVVSITLMPSLISTESSVLELSLNMPGTVETINEDFVEEDTASNSFRYTLKKYTEKSNLKLFTYRICQHNETVKVGEEILCQRCQNRCFQFPSYAKEQKTVKINQLIRIDSFQKQKQFQWLTAVNQCFTASTAIATYNNVQLYLSSGGKITFIQWNTSQFEQETVVLKYRQLICAHQIIAKSICIYCNSSVANISQQILNKKNFFEKQESVVYYQQFCAKIETVCPIMKWQVAVNQYFTNRTVLLTVAGVSKMLMASGIVTYLKELTSLDLISQTLVLMKYKKIKCRHQQINKDLVCNICLCRMKKSVTLYLFQFTETISQPKQLVQQQLLFHQNVFIEQLIAAQKAILIVDLDNTILHSVPTSQIQLASLKNPIQEYFLLPIKYQLNLQQVQQYNIAKLRPFLREFFYSVVTLFEVVIYTKGSRLYADVISNIMRAKFAGEQLHPNFVKTWQEQKIYFLKNTNCFKKFRVISREDDPDQNSKSIQKILPTRKDNFIALDDRGDVWKGNSWFYTKFYNFFQKKKPVFSDSNDNNKKQNAQVEVCQNQINQIKEEILDKFPISFQQYIKKSYNKISSQQKKQTNLFYQIPAVIREDYFLLFAAHALKLIHKKYFTNIQRKGKRLESQIEEGKPLSLFDCYKNFKKSLLKGYKIKFIGQKDNNSWVNCAKQIGASVVEEEQQLPNIVIRTRLLKKPQTKSQEVGQQFLQENAAKKFYNDCLQKLKMYSQVHNVPVVSSFWIHYCYENTHPFSYEAFTVTDPLRQSADFYHQEFQQARLHRKLIAESILTEIQLQMSKF